MSLTNGNMPNRLGSTPGTHAPLGAPARTIPAVGTPAPAPAPAPARPAMEDEGSIGLVEEDGGPQKAIHATGAALNSSVRRDAWKREAYKPGTGAVRMRSFHGRLSQQGLEYLDNQVNEWLDAHPEVEVKFVTSNVGTFEGKMREPALILNLWY